MTKSSFFVTIPSRGLDYEKYIYYELQKILNEKEIMVKFIQSNILDLPDNLDKSKKYTSVFLSNIISYMCGDDLEDFMNLIQYELYNMLDDNGLIAYGLGITPFFEYGEKLSNVHVLRKK